MKYSELFKLNKNGELLGVKEYSDVMLFIFELAEY